MTAKQSEFAKNITPNDGPRFVEATAYIMDPLSDDVIVETIELPKEDYERLRDKEGNVYVSRSYDKGERQSVLIEEKLWKSLAAVMIRTPQQREADYKRQKEDIRRIVANHTNDQQ